MKKSYFFYFILLSILISSCSSYSTKHKDKFDTMIEHYVDSTHLDMNKLDGGLYYKIIKPGNGKRTIQFTDRITFYYTGSFLNGKVFQEKTPKDALTFKVSQLIVGWQEAVMLLKEGGEIEIIVPPQLAYGKKNTDLIPPNSILKYDLTVAKVQ